MNINILAKYCDINDIIAATYHTLSEITDNKEVKLPSDGVAFNYDGMNFIAYNDKLPVVEQYYVFAHEIGHHVLNHLTARKWQKTAAETEADVFASVLMALNVFTDMKAI